MPVSASLLIPWFRFHPVTIEVGQHEVAVYPFQVMMLIGVLVSLVMAFLFARENQRSLRSTLDFAVHALVFAFPISLLFNGLFYQPETLRNLVEDPSTFSGIRLGWSMYGGVLGGFLGAAVWKWRRGGSILEIGDSLAFGGPFGWFIARLGCFAVHDHPGRISDSFLAVADFRVGAPPWPPRHDLGFYDAIVLLLISLVFLFLSRTPRSPGFYFGALGLLYAPARFLLDFLRAPYAEGGDVRYAGLTPSQYVSIGFFITGVLVMRRVTTPAAQS